MQHMIELYEMVSMNDASLSAAENEAILKARLALQMFEGAMQTFKTAEEPQTAAVMKAAA